MFRSADHTNVSEENDQQLPALAPNVKQEVAEEGSGELEIAMANNATGRGSSRPSNFLHLKNKEVFDYEPTANSIHASLWPHWWLKAVQSRYKLRKTEGKKNEKLAKGLQYLFKEALEVGTIKKN